MRSTELEKVVVPTWLLSLSLSLCGFLYTLDTLFFIIRFPNPDYLSCPHTRAFKYPFRLSRIEEGKKEERALIGIERGLFFSTWLCSPLFRFQETKKKQ